MTVKKEKIQKLISSILIVLILMPSFIFLSVPRKVEATGVPVLDAVGNILNGIGNAFNAKSSVANVTSTWLKLKEVAKDILKETLKVVARRALAEMTKSTVNWINTGFHGAPLFLENPGSFFKDVGETQIKEMVGIIGYDPIRFPFGKGYLLNTIQNYKRQLSDNVEYSMSKVTNDPAQLAQYRRNFNIGGWEGFILTTQYPQNNVIGFEMSAAEELLGKYEAVESKIKTTLDQGQGFLSPQVCKSDPSKSQLNPYKKPSFDSSSIAYDDSKQNYYYFLLYGGDPTATQSTIDQAYDDWQTYDAVYGSTIDAARYAFDMQYTCPEGLATTTPGSVVASKIIGAMNKPEEQASLNAALGNSLATIFDALLNKFIGDGLTSLSNKINPPADDDFNYYGETLGGSDSDTPWGGMPDQEIVLGDFKKEISGKTVVIDPATGVVTQEDIGDTCAKSTPPSYCATPGAATYIPGAIANTALELQLISNNTNNNQNPGLIEVLDSTWPVAKRLDICIPGPEKDWEKRLEEERDRAINTKLIIETSNDDPLKVRASRDAAREIRFAVASLKDWINTKMISALPGSILFMDAVKELDTNDQQYKQLTDKKREKMTVLARLTAIEASLAPITTQPATGSPQEKNLISIRKQYDAIAVSVANSASIEDLRSQLDLLKERKQNLLLLENQCNQERTAAGWNLPGGAKSTNNLPVNKGQRYYFFKPFKIGGDNNFAPGPTITSTGTEREVFCDVPIVNGYSHGDIIRPEWANQHGALPFNFRNGFGNPLGTPGFTDLPMVNAHWYYGDVANGFPVSVDIDCGMLFKVNDNDYKHAGDAQF